MSILKKENNMSFARKKYAVEAALLLGFQTESVEFPIIGEDGMIEVPESQEQLSCLWKMEAKDVVVPENYQVATNAGDIYSMDFRTVQGLECLFQKGAFLKDDNQDLLPDRLDVKFVLSEELDDSMWIAACNLAFRLGMETTSYQGSIIADKDYEGNKIIFEYAEQSKMTLEEAGQYTNVRFQGSGKDLEDFSAKVCGSFPKVDNWRTWRDLLLDMTEDFMMKGPDGQLAYLKASMEEAEGSYEAFVSPEMKAESKEVFKDVEFKNFKEGKVVYQKTYEYPWEVDVFEEIMKTEVASDLQAGDKVCVYGALSEDKEVRTKLVERLQNTVAETGAVLEYSEVICAYKQGFSWIDEIIIPRVKGKDVSKVEVYFKPFLPEGETEWVDENGATPSYHNVKAEDPDRWYDLPIRYLQELYPIEDVLVKELGIEREQVVFLPYEGTADITYLCKVSTEESVLVEESYKAQWSERPYMDSYPQLGKVHPSTGYIKVLVNGEEKVYRQISTDLEYIWNTYQQEVLPDCGKYAIEKNGGTLAEDLQPFFNKLHLDVTVSEPDFRVGCREDIISSLDALHEDMYFAGTDYFKNLGTTTIGTILDSPGLILPDIHQAEGKPRFVVTLYEQQKERPEIYRDGQLVCEPKKYEDVAVIVDEISYDEGKVKVHVAVSGVEESVVKAYAELLEKEVLSCSRAIDNCDTIIFNGVEANVPGVEKPVKNKNIADIDLHENELIGYETYLEIMEELKQVPGIEVFKTAVSYAGRVQYAIWLAPEYKGYLSMTKYLTNRPSEVINARHHANEVSSTNGIFILLKKLLTEDTYKGLADKLSLVMLPMENMDGAAIHYELQKEHPYWKFHVARFNALGKEFFYDVYKPITLHSEMLGYSRVFEKFAPDVVVDNHGVPSHEWEQQFSGYTSPSYKGFWLPRSLLYGYFWYISDERYQSNYLVNKKMEDVIADKIAESEEMTSLNLEWSAQFEKYAHQWLPKLFPADYYKNMINYWIPYKFGLPTNRYPAARFPWVTTVSYTSEVADETAQGEYLNLCARAHVAHDEAIIDLMTKAEHVYDCTYECHEDKIFAKYFRCRPMIV